MKYLLTGTHSIILLREIAKLSYIKGTYYRIHNLFIQRYYFNCKCFKKQETGGALVQNLLVIDLKILFKV